jgi:hypothetical protein
MRFYRFLNSDFSVVKLRFMEPTRIEAYLRSACSALDFDVGELWCAKSIPSKWLDL